MNEIDEQIVDAQVQEAFNNLFNDIPFLRFKKIYRWRAEEERWEYTGELWVEYDWEGRRVVDEL
jgi:hypothetical protein